MIAPTLLSGVLDDVAQTAALADDALARALRERYPEVHFSVCDDDDMPSRIPFVAENSLCRLYLVSSGDHCLSLTNDAEAATGVVVARITSDD